jgi:hypothetical protein
MKRTSHHSHRERGFVAVAYAAMLVAMIGFTGLAVDVGYMQFEKRKLQMAADAAAMGALREMERGNTDLVAAGQNDASLNGFTNGTDNTTVTVVSPPTSGAYAGDSAAIQVSVTHKMPLFFMQIFGQRTASISATSTARTSNDEGSIGACIFAMDPTASGALNVSGNLTISTACSAVVKSTSSTALMMGGNSTWNLTNGAAIGVVGGWDLYGSYVINSTTAAYETPVHIADFNDPLAHVATPTPGGLTLQVASGGWQDNNPHSSNTLSPGIYCGGMTIHGSVTFTPGIYVLAGGGMNIGSQASVSVGNAVTLSGGQQETGVMFYNTSSNSQSWGCSGGRVAASSITVNGTPSINLAGLSTTTPAGVLFFDDRSISGLSHKINGNSTSTFDGAMYFLNNTLTFNGNNKTPGFLYIVADMINLTGNANLGNDHSSLANVYTIAPSSTGGGLVQ